MSRQEILRDVTDFLSQGIVEVKRINQKNVEALLKDKKRIIGKNFGHLHITNKDYLSVSLYPYYRYIWGNCKDPQRQGKVHHVLCLGSIVCIKLWENGSLANLLNISDIPDFPSDSNIENSFL